MSKFERWKVTSAEWTDREPYTLTVAFENPDDERERIKSTMPAGKWQRALMIGWELQEERKLTAELGKRLNDALEENFSLKISGREKETEKWRNRSGKICKRRTSYRICGSRSGVGIFFPDIMLGTVRRSHR